MLDAQGTQQRDADGNLLWEHARLDLRLEGGPEEPTTYGDVVVSQARADSWARLGASADGAVAAEAARSVFPLPPVKWLLQPAGHWMQCVTAWSSEDPWFSLV